MAKKTKPNSVSFNWRNRIMKKILLVVAMLIIAAPVLATVSVTATDKGSGVVEVKYNCSAAEKVRAFALDITVDNGSVINNIRDFNRGESKKPGGGYGIFPGKFAALINPASPNWADTNYNPVAPVGDPNAKSGLGTNAITVELGTLYVDVNSPGTSGLLFRLDVNGNGATDCNLSIALNSTRGSIVLEDATLAPSPVLTGTKVTFPPSCVTPTNEVGAAKATAEGVWTGQGFTLGAATAVVDCAHLGLIISQDTACVTLPNSINYSYGVAPAVPNVVGMTDAAAVTALTNAGFVIGTDVNVACDGLTPVGSVCSSNPAAGATPGCGTTVILSIVSYPIKDTAPASLYANWVTVGKPQCWAYPRQCRGDADGKKLGTQWVSGNDLVILKGAITKALTAIPAGGICSDFDHKKLGTQWVSGNDLAILKAYITKAESLVPMCGDTSTTADSNYWYWCLPSGTCPSGQVCAPVGVCPNTP
jgi:hypothetical protein